MAKRIQLVASLLLGTHVQSVAEPAHQDIRHVIHLLLKRILVQVSAQDVSDRLILREHLSEIQAIYEVHHYHHTCSCQATACTAVEKSPVELSAVLSPKMQQLRHPHPFKVYRPYTLPPVMSEQPPPFIRTHLKPTVSTSLPY